MKIFSSSLLLILICASGVSCKSKIKHEHITGQEYQLYLRGWNHVSGKGQCLERTSKYGETFVLIEQLDGYSLEIPKFRDGKTTLSFIKSVDGRYLPNGTNDPIFLELKKIDPNEYLLFQSFAVYHLLKDPGRSSLPVLE